MTKGQKIVYRLTQEPTEGKAIEASLTGSASMTKCPYGKTAKVGSLSCTRCKHYGGAKQFAIATGNPFITHTREIYCKKELTN